MRHLYWTLLTVWLLCKPMLGQTNPSAELHDALVLENGGSFETAAKVAKAAIDSGQLSSNELGTGYIILAVACRGAGDLTAAQIAFEHAMQVLEHDREHPEDYAFALENYAGLYSELGQLDVAGPMWRKALHLRQKIGDHAGAALSLTRLAEYALARNRVREAQRYLEQASNEAEASPDLTDDGKAFFLVSAREVAAQLGVDEVVADLLPTDKLEYVRRLSENGHRAGMVGDGINDAPALMQASVGIAMGSGTDVAKESADVVLIGSDLSRLVETLQIARCCRRIILQNFVGTLAVDTAGIGLAAFGLLNPLLAAFIHVSSEMTFILNSARFLPPISAPNSLRTVLSGRTSQSTAR